jgi:poly-beta-hydroxybutyrate-responsive repressor
MPDRPNTTDANPPTEGSPAARTTRARRTGRTDPGVADKATDDAYGPDPAADGSDPAGGGDAAPAEPSDEREPLPGWPPRDILAPFVLLAVSLQRSHGYIIEDYLRALGLFGITMSTLYRTLRQMEKDGFLESTWEPGPTGPARRVYSITADGQTVLGSSAAMLSAYRTTIDRFFGLYDAGPGAARPRADVPTDEPPHQSTDQKENAS